MAVVSKDHVVRALELAVEAAGGRKEFTQLHGIAQGHLSDMLNGQRPPSDKVLTILGYRKSEPLYERIAEATDAA